MHTIPIHVSGKVALCPKRYLISSNSDYVLQFTFDSEWDASPVKTARVIFDEDVRPIGPQFFEGLFEPAIKVAKERDIPLYCGEYGVIDLADREDAVRWLSDIHDAFEKYAIGRALWNYKEKDFGIAGEDARPYLDAIADKL